MGRPRTGEAKEALELPLPRELTSEQCRWRCDASQFDFGTTQELPAEIVPIGQQRAMNALDFGADIQSEGYNIFALGPPGTGRTSLVLEMLQRKADEMPAPSDCCYVYNFDDPRCPRALELPAGMGATLLDDLHELIEDVDREITRSFDGDEYSERRDELLREFREARNKELQAFEREVQEAGLAIGRGPAGLIVAPAKDGEVMSPQEYQQLPQEEREALDQRRQEMQEKLDEIMRRGQRAEKQARQKVAELDREVALYAIGGLVKDLQEKYAEIEQVVEHLNQVRDDIIANVDAFREEADEPAAEQLAVPQRMLEGPHRPHDRYRVNVVWSHKEGEGAPVVFETNPTIENLTGDVEHVAYMGALVTDFTMVKPGALHRANGGYLVLEALSVLTKPYAWEALKRALKSAQVCPESIREHLRLVSTVTLQPEPIALNVKVVLIGSPLLYYLLHEHDEDFRKLFKVKSDFGVQMDRSAETVEEYGRFVGARCHQEGLTHFTPDGVAAVVEYGARLAEDHEKLSTRFLEVADLVREAAFWCSKEGADLVGAGHVQRALKESIQRSNRIEERLLEMIEEGTLLIDTKGKVLGQVNGISLLPLGDYVVGKPSRITARSYLGKPGILNVEREVELSGPIHSKGTMILTGFLGERFATREPMSCSISLAFEQVYEEVEGDSAASAELYALLSSLSGMPLRQDLAVTGSVNQHGQIQAVGGVNRKIEGFFATCKLMSLTGAQGVIIPATNVRNLMLRQEVVEAVAAGRFHIYPVETIDEGIELLTGVAAGQRDEEGEFPEGTINAAVAARLAEAAEAHRKHQPGGERREAGSG